MRKIAYVGVDYHVNTLSIAVLIEGEKCFLSNIIFKNDDKMVHKYLKKLSKDYELRVCYEASSCGYVFQRKLRTWGYHCDVIAPSLIPKKPGDRRKNDFRDARNLAQLYRDGSLTVVKPPSEEEESVRGLIRCRMALKEAAKRAKLQINTFLLAHDLHWEKSKWTGKHRQWLSKTNFSDSCVQTVFTEFRGHLEYLETRISHLDSQIEEIGRSEIYGPSVKKLRAFKGIGTLAAMLLIAEITDFRRFASPRALMAFLGLIPSEDSTGEKRRGGPITKTGNPRCRTQLIESVQQCTKRPVISKVMKSNLAEVDAHSANIAINCMNRLYKRFWSLANKGKSRQVAITAIAREFVGFIWAMMQTQPAAA
jgi:transposase